ncbi:thiamine-phosphate kinase [soil metagenome]
MTVARIRLGAGAEFDLIRRFLEDDRSASGHDAGAAGADAGTAPPVDGVRIGPGDDCAVVAGDGIALSVDMSVEGVHFTREWLEPEEIGYRATAAALSDLAAVAATPIGILVALAVTADDAAAIATRIMRGTRAAAADCGAILLGGDLTRTTGPLVIDVVAVGSAARPILRSGAQPGDAVWVTGRLGAAAAAVREWKSGRSPPDDAREAFARPRPRTAEAVWLARHAAVTALIDLSDGLGGDVGHIAAASGVQITLDAAAIPVHPAAVAATTHYDDALRLALAGGDDYELCFTAGEDAIEALRAAFTDAFELLLTRVGTVSAVTGSDAPGVLLRDASGRIDVLRSGGYDHLRENSM